MLMNFKGSVKIKGKVNIFFKYLEYHILTKGFDINHGQAYIIWWDSPFKN